MRLTRHLMSPLLAALALSLAGAAVAQTAGSNVMLPWQKPQPKAHPPSNFTEILPWLKPGAGDKAPPPATADWQAKVDEPKAPEEPFVPDPGPQGRQIETGAIAPNGLVLKKPLPAINVKSGAENAAAPKIKRSIALPGDRPVGQAKASEVPPTAADVAAEAPAEDAPAIEPAAASPVDAAEASSPAPETQPLAAGAAAESVQAAQGAEAVAAGGVPEEATTVRGQSATARAVGEPQALPLHSGAPAAARLHSGPAAVPHVAAERSETAQATGVPTVEATPALPQAEEAPPIPDALPDAVVTPVAKPASPDLPVQRAKELPEAATAQPQAAKPDVAAPAPGQSKPRAPDRLADGANVAQQYCFNIADAAKDARYAWQKKTLADIELELNKRIALLDERTAEYQKWLARRDEFIRNAEDNVVKIYAGMKVDAAALQLALMNEETAAAVLAKLNTRNASAILNEMEASKASKLTMIMTGAAKLKRKKELQKPAAAQGADAAPAPGSPAAAGEGGRS